jgi:uroporphyrinogen decarboxylase
MLSARDNALEIIRFGTPDRVVGGPPCHGIAYTGANHEGYAGGGHDCPVGTEWEDIWGVGFRKRQEGVMGFPIHHPLPDPSALKTYRWPEPDDARIIARVYEQAATHDPNADSFLSGSHRETLWERTYNLVGMEALMVYFHDEPNFVREVLHGVMDFQLGIAKHYIEVGVEIAGLGDDLGTQLGPLLSPALLNEFLVPEYARLFSFYKSRGVPINFHSCGNLDAVLDVFLQLGVDILNPVQASANDLERVRQRTQGKMALQGALSSALIVDGPPDRIVAEVRERMWQLGRDGGYFCGPDQGMPWPEAHIAALWGAVEGCGRYPLSHAREFGGVVNSRGAAN